MLGREATPHFEQAVFADGLTPSRWPRCGQLVAAQWQALLAAWCRISRPASRPTRRGRQRPQGRVRIGLYSYQNRAPVPAGRQSATGEDT